MLFIKEFGQFRPVSILLMFDCLSVGNLSPQQPQSVETYGRCQNAQN